MDEALKEAIGRIETAAAQSTQAAHAATAAANASTAAVYEVKRDFATLRRDFGVLWRKVHGSDPPPPAGDPSMAPTETLGATPLDELIASADARASSAEAKAGEVSLEVAALEGRMIAGFATLAKAQKESQAELQAQSKSMGVGKRGWEWIASPAGMKALLRNIGAAAALVAAIAAVVNSCHPAAASAPQHQVQR